MSYGHEMEMEAEYAAEMGDPRRCPVHPDVRTSSNDGMFDAPCGKCEAKMEEDWEREREARVRCPIIRLAKQFTSVKQDDGTWFCVSDASDLNWPAGRAPEKLLVIGKGRSVVFTLDRALGGGGDIVAWEYRSAAARDVTLRVAND